MIWQKSAILPVRHVKMLSNPELDWSANSYIFALMFFIFRGSTYFYSGIPKYSSSRLMHKTVLLYPDG